MKTLRAQSKTVFVVKNYDTDGIFEDEVLEQGNRKFKSIKFRHTYYKADDFFYTYKDALAFVRDLQLRNTEIAY